MTFPELADRLRALDVSCLSDACKTVRVLDAGIRPIAAGLKLVGRAYPVSCCDDFLPVLGALAAARSGDVLMIDGQGGHRALAGELFATEAKRKGLAGIVVDGAVRDVTTLRRLEWPVYARWIRPVAGTHTGPPRSPVQIRCGSVIVTHGDVVVGDEDGVLVATEADLADSVAAAEAIQQNETEVLRRMSEGRALTDLLNLAEHLDAVREGRKSQLRFLL